MLAACLSGVYVTHPYRHQVALLEVGSVLLVKFNDRMRLIRLLSSCVFAGLNCSSFVSCVITLLLYNIMY